MNTRKLARILRAVRRISAFCTKTTWWDTKMGNIKSITAGIFGATHLFAAPVTATVIDFNAAPSLSNGGLSIGNPYVEDGYQLSVLTGFGILSMQAGAQSNRFSNNGTTSAYVYSNSSNPPPAFQLSKVGGSAFSLLSIDVAELFNNGDSAFPFAARNVSFTGHLSGGGTVMAGFNLDLISDGVLRYSPDIGQ